MESLALALNVRPIDYDRHMHDVSRAINSYLFEVTAEMNRNDTDYIELDAPKVEKFVLMKNIDKLWLAVAAEYATIDSEILYDAGKKYWINFFLDLSAATRQLEEDIPFIPLEARF